MCILNDLKMTLKKLKQKVLNNIINKTVFIFSHYNNCFITQKIKNMYRLSGYHAH